MDKGNEMVKVTLNTAVTFLSCGACLLGFNRVYAEAFAVSREGCIEKGAFHPSYLSEADCINYQLEDEHVIAETISLQRKMQVPYDDGGCTTPFTMYPGFVLLMAVLADWLVLLLKFQRIRKNSDHEQSIGFYR